MVNDLEACVINESRKAVLKDDAAKRVFHCDVFCPESVLYCSEKPDFKVL